MGVCVREREKARQRERERHRRRAAVERVEKSVPEACQYVPSSTFCPFAHPYTIQYSTHPSSIKHQASGAGPHSRLPHTYTTHTPPQALKRWSATCAEAQTDTHTLTFTLTLMLLLLLLLLLPRLSNLGTSKTSTKSPGPAHILTTRLHIKIPSHHQSSLPFLDLNQTTLKHS